MKTEQNKLFHLLMIFREVVRQGSFTAAATTLGTTKSSVSQYVSRLEQRLGTQLLIRSTRALSMTNAGEKLLQRSNELKRLLDITLDELNNIKQQPKGSFKVTAPHALARSIVLPVIHRLVEQFPEIEPCLIIDDGNQDIVKQGIDIAIRVGQLQDSDLRAKKIGAQQEMFVASNAFLSSLSKPITASNIEEQPFIATSWQTTNYIHNFKKANNSDHEIYLKPKFEVNSAIMAIELVLLGSGVALLPDLLVKRFIKEGALRQVLADLQSESHSIYYVHAYKKGMTIEARWFIKLIKEMLE